MSRNTENEIVAAYRKSYRKELYDMTVRDMHNLLKDEFCDGYCPMCDLSIRSIKEGHMGCPIVKIKEAIETIVDKKVTERWYS